MDYKVFDGLWRVTRGRPNVGGQSDRNPEFFPSDRTKNFNLTGRTFPSDGNLFSIFLGFFRDRTGFFFNVY